MLRLPHPPVFGPCSKALDAQRDSATGHATKHARTRQMQLAAYNLVALANEHASESWISRLQQGV